MARSVAEQLDGGSDSVAKPGVGQWLFSRVGQWAGSREHLHLARGSLPAAAGALLGRSLLHWSKLHAKATASPQDDRTRRFTGRIWIAPTVVERASL